MNKGVFDETEYHFIALISILTDCSAFKSSRKIDITPFSENARTLFGEATKISQPFQWKHVKSYTSIPELRQFIMHGTRLIEALRGIVYYSNQVVAIHNSNLSDRDKMNSWLIIFTVSWKRHWKIKSSTACSWIKRVPECC